jgi:hypothetical protein
MRPRPVRPNVYLPVVKFGVVNSDWKFVLSIALISYSGPFFFNLKLLGAPLEMITGVGSAALSIAFFNWARIGRRPYWLQHKIRSLIENPRSRPALPADDTKKPRRPWVIRRRGLLSKG